MTTTNTETWGNIELPGLSDEELFKKNWNLSQAEKEKWLDPEYRSMMVKKRQETSKDPEYRKKYLAAMEKLINDPQYRVKYLAAMEDYKTNEEWRRNQKEASDKFRNDPIFKEKKRKEMKANSLDPEFQKKRLEGHKKALSDPTWIENVRKSKVKFRKKIQTPDGIFDSRKAAAEFYKIDPTQINSRIKKWPDQYYYITLNEKDAV